MTVSWTLLVADVMRCLQSQGVKNRRGAERTDSQGSLTVEPLRFRNVVLRDASAGPPTKIDAAPYRDASINQKVTMRIAVASDNL